MRPGSIALAAALLCLDAAGLAPPARALNIGDELAEKAVRLKTADEREVSIGDVAGQKGTLVLFTCNACPWVKAWETRIAELGNEYRKQGIGVIAINSNDPSVVREDGFETMQQRAKERGFEFPYAVDAGSVLARAYGATRTPEAFLFDGAGKLVYHGTIDDNAQKPDDVKERYLKDALQALVDGKPIKNAETKSLGCTIKFYPES
jgi:peroxiredoxin